MAGKPSSGRSCTNSPSILWLRLDLRLADNPALRAAVERGAAVLPVFIWAPEEEGDWPPGAASRWWLHHSLAALDNALRACGSRLVVVRGPTLNALRELVRQTGAQAVYWNRRYEPAVVARDTKITAALREQGVEAESFNAALLHEPWMIQNQSSRPFRVFTPYWRHCLAREDPPAPLPSPRALKPPARWPRSLPLEALELLPQPDWASGMRESWQPGEAGASARLKRFLDGVFERYDDERNRPDLVGTSRLSPHLHFGEISPRQVWHALRRQASRHGWPEKRWRASQFLTELGWREFAHHLLWHFPETPAEPLRPEFKAFPWRRNATWLRAWQRGKTGYPIVDAGMRELWATGWMHNRMRMIVASFLVKDLLIDWREGARWFWDTLVDADLANNTLGWQWTTGCGADAAPFFRVFNPTIQGRRFDPHGVYVRRWCPELANLSDRWIHEPHAAPSEVLHSAGIEPGRSYPLPIVQHSIAREVALEAYQRLRQS